MKNYLKQLKSNIKEDFQDFWSFVRRPYFYLRRLKNRIKFFKKLWPTYFAAWDICETILDFNFELFCNFYEDGDLELVEWNSDKYHKNAKKWFDEIYKYWKIERPKLIEDCDNLLMEWSKHYKFWWEESNEIDENGEKYFEYKSEENEEAEELFKQHSELEQEIEKLDKKYLKKIIDLKDYMWT